MFGAASSSKFRNRMEVQRNLTKCRCSNSALSCCYTGPACWFIGQKNPYAEWGFLLRCMWKISKPLTLSTLLSGMRRVACSCTNFEKLQCLQRAQWGCELTVLVWLSGIQQQKKNQNPSAMCVVKTKSLNALSNGLTWLTWLSTPLIRVYPWDLCNFVFIEVTRP